MIKISTNELHWNGKIIVFTWHFKKEFEKLKKPLEFVLDILEYGEHKLISKKQQKYNVFYRYKIGYLCLSYVIQENIILIHIKPKRR